MQQSCPAQNDFHRKTKDPTNDLSLPGPKDGIIIANKTPPCRSIRVLNLPPAGGCVPGRIMSPQSKWGIHAADRVSAPNV